MDNYKKPVAVLVKFSTEDIVASSSHSNGCGHLQATHSYLGCKEAAYSESGTLYAYLPD